MPPRPYLLLEANHKQLTESPPAVAILPWGAGDDLPKISPVTASRRFLEHLAAAWQAAFPDAPLAEQIVVLTVPASFDASAREVQQAVGTNPQR